jgi:bacteriorhodopsin
MEIVQTTVFVSLALQVVTGLIDLYVITTPAAGEKVLLRQLLAMELMVQVVEGIFYLWLVLNITKATDITRNRYWDWMLTTPVMLLTLSSYLIYLRLKQRVSKEEDVPTLRDIVKEHSGTFLTVVGLNAMMLLFGYLGETRVLGVTTSVVAGFLPFFAMFYIIYDSYAKHTRSGTALFTYFFGVWGLYGVAATLPYTTKNIFYNILDICSKNFFGLFLAYQILRPRTDDDVVCVQSQSEENNTIATRTS